MKTDSIIILGGGSAGWMTATTLIRAFPNKKITVIESPDVPIIGVGESTLGSLRRWTKYIGLDESSFFPYTDASYKLSIKFTDFYKKDAGSFYYPFGAVQYTENNPYLEWFSKKYYDPELPITDMVESLHPQAQLFLQNKFRENQDGQLGVFNHETDAAYHFDAVKFGSWLKNHYCLPRGVELITDTVTDIEQDSDGISKLFLKSGNNVSADLYVDCTGWSALLLSKTLNEPFDSYSDMLPNNKAWATRVPYKNRGRELEGYTNCTAIENGWCWNIPLWSRLGTGYVYSDKFTSKDEALIQFKNYLMSNKMVEPRTVEEIERLEFKDITMKVGIHQRTFVKNVVAIGLAAGFIEPLESNGLFSVHEFLFKLVDILQRGDISQFDRDMYNISVRDLFDSFAKFVALHYALSHRDDTEYWKAIQNREFRDKNNDPVSQVTNRSGGLYGFVNNYMEEWGYQTHSGGMPYIGTGLNFLMLNENRIQSIETRFGHDFERLAKGVKNRDDIAIAHWRMIADLSPTLENYLYERFYKNSVDL